MMTSREVVKRTIKFQKPDRLAHDFPEKYGSDMSFINMIPSPDDRPHEGVDEWGAVWENIGISSLGQVKTYPLKDWKDFDKFNIPDINDPARWTVLEDAREKAGDKFLLGSGISIYERVHFIRGLEDTWMDIYQNRDELCKLLDILVEMNLVTIEKYAKAGVDGLIWADDWGLQDRLMINPDLWRQIWKPRYERIYQAAHDNGILTFLHSCGYIVAILGDLIEVGLDVVHMDQQENMGLELLSERFAGRLTFYSPVDIQTVMIRGDQDEIRDYCRKMVQTLNTPDGGFIPRWYMDPVGAGHSEKSLDTMCKEFLRLSDEISS